jgi:catechol 2,3-dioxygenase-like lactoylglutathione lyase family enzyme
MRLSYVRLLVDQFDECFRFYRDVMELEVAWGAEGERYAEFVAGSDTRLALTSWQVVAEAVNMLDRPRGDTQDQVQLVFEVSDVDACAARLGDRGARVVADPQDREVWGVRTVHLRDPEGYLIEVNAPLTSSD